MERTELEALASRSAMRGAMWDDVKDVPTWLGWQELRERFITAVEAMFSTWIAPDQAHFQEQLLFAIGRLDDGAALVRYFELRGRPSHTLRILDIGAGNGGVGLALANCRQNRVFTLDIVPNNILAGLRAALAIPIESVVATGEAIPFAPDSFDVVLLIDTLEHLPDARAVAVEIMRILRPGGMCMLTTPARVRHLLGRDPHYGIRGLALLPNAGQRFVVNRVFRRRIKSHDGADWDAYDVEHLFWHAREVASLFPSPRRVEVLFNREYHPPPPLSRAWLRHPAWIREWLTYQVRGFFYDRIVIYKESLP